MLEPMEPTPLPQNFRGLRRVEYDVLVERGVFDDDMRLELLDGRLVTKMAPSPLHARLATRLMEQLFHAAIGADLEVRVNQPFAAGEYSQPEPDVEVVPRSESLTSHPDRALLLIEVCNTSDYRDRVIKMRIYADAGVPEYWIVDPNARHIEIYTEPQAGGYAKQRIVSSGVVAPSALPEARVEIARLFA